MEMVVGWDYAEHTHTHDGKISSGINQKYQLQLAECECMQELLSSAIAGACCSLLVLRLQKPQASFVEFEDEIRPHHCCLGRLAERDHIAEL